MMPQGPRPGLTAHAVAGQLERGVRQHPHPEADRGPAAKPAAKKPTKKVARRSSAETAKLQKAVIKGLKAGKSAAALSQELGISRPYVYMLRNKG